MNKSIYIFTQTLLKGGAEKQAVLLANSLSRDYEVNLIVFYGELIHPTHVHELKNVRIFKLKGSFIKKILDLTTIIEHNSILFNYLMLPNFLGGIISSFKKNVISYGGVRSSRLLGYKRVIEKISHNWLNSFTIFNNRSGLEYCLNYGFNEKKTIYIPNGIIIPHKYSPKKKMENKKSFKILSVGRYEDVKNYPFALKVIGEVIAKFPNVKYSIVGWGRKEQEIRKYIIKNKLSDQVKMVINPGDLSSYYEESHLFLQTSKFEGISNTILEAMSFGLPIIATDAGDNKFIVRNEIDGFIFAQNDVESFVNCINYLIANKEEIKRLGENSFEHARNLFSIKKFKSNYNELISQV